MEVYDVLVVGAGPTGLMMASELTRYGLNCKIIEKKPKPSEESKALACQARTLEIFHILGLSSSFLEQGVKLSALNPMSGQKHLGKIDLSKLESPFPFILSLPQSKTEEILQKHVESLGCKVQRECELTGLKEVNDGVVAELSSVSQETTSIQVKWVIGCDGAHSFVRKFLDLSFLGNAFPEVFSLADVEMSWDRPDDEVFAFLSPKGVLAGIPLPGKNRYRLIFQLDRCQNQSEHANLSNDNLHVELPPPSLEEVKERVRELADQNAEISNPEWLANFHVNSRLAKRYQVGRFFLAGDAAHIHSPIGGQGMNTGLQDAFNLAWKMALVHQGKATPKLLDSYHDERHATARGLLKGTEVGTHVATLKKGWEIFLRNHLLSWMIKHSAIQKKLISTISQLKIHYPVSPFIREEGSFPKGVKVGFRMPNYCLYREDSPVEIFDLLKNPTNFVILLLKGDKSIPKGFEERLEALNLPIKVHTISLSKSDAEFYDPNGFLHEAMGAKKGACYVIRPDTYIGYRQTPIHEKKLLNYFAAFTNFNATELMQ